MKNSTLFLTILFLALLSIGTGCDADHQEEYSPFKAAEHQLRAEENQPKTAHEVKGVMIHEAPKNVNSPSEAVVQQFEVRFENGESQFPDKESIISESTLGDKSLLTLHSPEGQHTYGIFLYERKSEWEMKGAAQIAANPKRSLTDQSGLALPMAPVNSTHLHVKEEGTDIWAFVNEQKIVTVSRLDRYSFPANEQTEEITLENGTQAYISQGELGHRFIYYFDSGKVILVAGNVKREPLIVLANSLPSVTVPNFPKPTTDS